MDIEKEFDDFVYTINEVFKIAETGCHIKPTLIHRNCLYDLLTSAIQELQESKCSRVTKKEIEYLLNAYRLIKKVGELR